LQQAKADAEQAREEAERANAAKSEFLSRMSHELRTPMNAILGFGQLLAMDDLDDEQRDGVEQILKGGQHLLSLINEVLDISRIEAGELSLSVEPVPAGEIVQEVRELLEPLAVAGNIQLRGEFPLTSKLYIQADRQRLKQVLLNLLSNAIKYNRAGGNVTFNCAETAGHRLRVSITDTGLGLSPQDIQKLFMPFERLEAGRGQVEGTGLGLAHSKRLVEVMGGEIGVESTLGQGSTFWVEFPVVDTPLQQMDAGAEKLRGAASPLLSQSKTAKQRTILYIEDNLSNMRLIERLLSRHPDVELLTAMLGSLGLDLAREHQPHLILLDLHLPDINGDEVLQQLQANEATRAIPVVMLSADATPRQIERLRAAGARDYLTKPLNVKRFHQMLDDNLNSVKH
jgi:signal transduction histidine kinase